MKASELVEKSVDDLNKQLLDLREEQFKLRMAKATGRLDKLYIFTRKIIQGVKFKLLKNILILLPFIE